MLTCCPTLTLAISASSISILNVDSERSATVNVVVAPILMPAVSTSALVTTPAMDLSKQIVAWQDPEVRQMQRHPQDHIGCFAECVSYHRLMHLRVYGHDCRFLFFQRRLVPLHMLSFEFPDFFGQFAGQVSQLLVLL